MNNLGTQQLLHYLMVYDPSALHMKPEIPANPVQNLVYFRGGVMPVKSMCGYIDRLLLMIPLKYKMFKKKKDT